MTSLRYLMPVACHLWHAGGQFSLLCNEKKVRYKFLLYLVVVLRSNSTLNSLLSQNGCDLLVTSYGSLQNEEISLMISSLFIQRVKNSNSALAYPGASS